MQFHKKGVIFQFIQNHEFKSFKSVQFSSIKDVIKKLQKN